RVGGGRSSGAADALPPPVQQALLHRGRGGGDGDRGRREPGQLRVVEAYTARRLVLVQQPRIEQQRVIGAQRDLGTGGDQAPQRHVLGLLHDAQRGGGGGA